MKLCGFDLSLLYDENLELISYDDDLDMDLVVNTKAYTNGLRMNYSGTRDVTKQRDILSLTFRVSGGAGTVLPIRISMNSVYEISGNDPTPAAYTTVDSVILVR